MTVTYPIAGIDVAKHSLDVAVLDADQNCSTWSLASDQVELKKLARRLLARGIRLVVLEATGGLEVGVMLALEAEGLCVARILYNCVDLPTDAMQRLPPDRSLQSIIQLD